MARASGSSLKKSAGTKSKTSKKFNETGYIKRQERKAKKAQASTSDVYEYEAEKGRRSKVGLELDKDEELDGGLGDTEDHETLRARLIGENEENEMIASEDDEEIDSDAAFEESDNDRFAGFFSEKKKKLTKKKQSIRFAEVDLNEDSDHEMTHGDAITEEEEESGDDAEFFDLLDILDGRGNFDADDDEPISSVPTPKSNTTTRQASDGDDDETDEEGSDEDESIDEDEFAPSDDEDAAPEALEDLQKFVSTLDTASQKRKSPSTRDDADSTNSRPRKRRMLKEQTEAGPENELRVQSKGILKLDDLLAPLDPNSSSLALLKKSAKALLVSSSKSKTLSAPLPQRAQDRLDREAAYEQTKEEVDKWKSTMKRIKEAEHLSFPLQEKPTGRVSNLELTAKFKPSTALESAVDTLLKSAKLREEDIQHTEDTMLQKNNLTVEEVAERRTELRKMRELMFRADVKAKRVSKIKSKTYRKIKRKERERLEEKINGEPGSDDEAARLKHEVTRARERATLRHKNTGKWAKQMKSRNGFEEGDRTEIEEMLDRGEQLRRRMEGDDTDDQSDDGSDVDVDVEMIKQNAFNELEAVRRQDDDQEETSDKRSKIFEMKFMKDAMARQQQEADRIADDFLQDLGSATSNASDAEDSNYVVSRTGGRMSFRPGDESAKQNATHANPSATHANSVVIALSHPSTPEPDSNPAHVPQDVNPWLKISEETKGPKAPRQKNDVIISKDSKDADKSKNKLKKHSNKTKQEKSKMIDDAIVEITSNNVLSLGDKKIGSSSKTKILTGPPGDVSDNASDANSELDVQEATLSSKKKKSKKATHAFEQRDLVALAFAGDNVVQQFEDAKRKVTAADAPKEVDTTIPGWGSWGGSGVKRGATKPQYIKQVAGVDPKTRADYNKSHVIISERKDKKAAKYQVKDLPYPYTSKAQFDRRMEQPLGVEWNTRVGFQRGTLPKVVKKMGTIIDPLQKVS